MTKLKLKNISQKIFEVLYPICLVICLQLAFPRRSVTYDVYKTVETVCLVILILGAVLGVIFNGKPKYGIVLVLFIVYELYLTLLTGIIANSFANICYSAFRNVVLASVVCFDFKKICKSLVYACWFALIANLISFFFVEKTQNSIYFIGGKNAITIYLLPMAFYVAIYSMMNGKKYYEPLVFCLLSVASILYSGSSTGIVIVAIMAVLLLTSKFIKNKYFIVFGILAVNLCLIFFNTKLADIGAWQFFTGLLGKRSTLTGRFDIWENVLNLFYNKPVWGNGRYFSVQIIAWDEVVTFTEAHNSLLEFMVTSGIVGTALLLAIFAITIFRLDINDKTQKLAYFAVVGMSLNSLTEAIHNGLFIIIFAVINVICITENKKRHLVLSNTGEGINNAGETT